MIPFYLARGLRGIVPHWRLAAFAALVAALAVQSIRLDMLQNEYEVFVVEARALSEKAIAEVEARNAYMQLVNEELEYDIATQREAMEREKVAARTRYDKLHRKYLGVLDNARGGAVPETGAGAPVTVQGCIPAERLDAAIRRDLGALHEELRALVGRGSEAIADRGYWMEWARRAQACPKRE